MFDTIVIGIGGRAGDEDALALARRLAEPGTRLVAVHAFPIAELKAGAEKALAGWVPGDHVERRVVADLSPAHALHDVASELEADLIVVGSSHRGVVGRVLLGDVSRSAMHGATCMVAVAPRGTGDHALPIRAVGTGYEDTPQARAALSVAAALAERHQATLRVLSAVAVPSPMMPYAYPVDWERFEHEQREAARADLAEATAGLAAPVVCDVVVDSAGRALVALSQAVDLMVVGSRGWGAARSILLGSAADVLVHQSRCPVLLVPSP